MQMAKNLFGTLRIQTIHPVLMILFVDHWESYYNFDDLIRGSLGVIIMKIAHLI